MKMIDLGPQVSTMLLTHPIYLCGTGRQHIMRKVLSGLPERTRGSKESKRHQNLHIRQIPAQRQRRRSPICHMRAKILEGKNQVPSPKYCGAI